MTEPLRKYHSSDVPEYSSYPAEPDRPVVAEVVDFTVVSEMDAMPRSAARPAGDFDDHGRKIGQALGRLVNRISEMMEPVRQTVDEQIDRIEDDVTIARATAEKTYKDAQRKLANAARQGVYEARQRAQQLQRKATQTVNDHPAETLAAIGVAGIIAGVGLRAWRENRG